MKAIFHLPGLFEFTAFYRAFLPLYRDHPDWFYPFCEIGSIYGAPSDCLWGGGRVGFGEDDVGETLVLLADFGISPRLTFSNALLTPEHLGDKKCNELCAKLNGSQVPSGVIVTSDLLLDYLKERYPHLYFISSTTKVLTHFEDFKTELNRPDFRYVVPDFRLNKALDKLNGLTQNEKNKVEFLCNECCSVTCPDRLACYLSVSRKSLGVDDGHICASPTASRGYRFSDAMENPAFIGIDDIQKTYLPMGFTNFKIEGRGLGSALLLEFVLHYLTKPENHLKLREELYLDATLDLF